MAAATLLDLPIEVQWQIADELPLSSYLILALHVCPALRLKLTSTRSSKWQRASSSRFSLVVWKQAAKEWRECYAVSGEGTNEAAALAEGSKVHKRTTSIWDTNSSDTPKPASAVDASIAWQRSIYRNRVLPASSWRSTGDMATDDPASDEGETDIDFLVACLDLLFAKGASQPLPSLTGTLVPASSLRTLSLLSQKAIGLARLLALLHSNTLGLGNVQTILITSAESTLWYDYAPQQHGECHAISPSHCARSSQDSASSREGSAPTCTETQAIAVPSARARRGYGLQVGFKCLCYGSRRSSGHPQSSSGNDMPPTPFHVILHDWYDADEAMGTEDMLAHSHIECNWCGHDIVF